MTSEPLIPLLLGPNLPRSFYRGSGAIHRLRGTPDDGDRYRPEDWIGSTTKRFGRSDGVSRLPDGRLLSEVIAADPERWLGPGRGDQPALLVKLLDAGQRLPLHVHPDRGFAATHLHCSFGKTEAWIVLAAGPDAAIHVGFNRPVSAAELAGWVDSGDGTAMLAATNRVPVRPGDAFLCPARTPHAIGTGLLILELQEPTDFSVLLEWDGFDIDGRAEGHLGLGFDTALQTVDRSPWDEAAIDALRGPEKELRPGVRQMLPDAADPFFRAESCTDGAELPAAFAVLVVISGEGELKSEHGSTPLRTGATVLIPYGAGPSRLRGSVQAVRCLPPD